MKKVILLSIRPEHAVKILNGKKTLELRKSVPKDFENIIKKHGGIWVNVYITKGKPYIRELGDNYFTECSDVDVYKLNGKVAFRFWFDEYDKYYFNPYQGDYRLVPKSRELLTNATMPLSELCLTLNEVERYGKEKDLFAWHINELEILGKIKVLGDFFTFEDVWISEDTLLGGMETMPHWSKMEMPLRKPPMSWRYALERE